MGRGRNRAPRHARHASAGRWVARTPASPTALAMRSASAATCTYSGWLSIPSSRARRSSVCRDDRRRARSRASSAILISGDAFTWHPSCDERGAHKHAPRSPNSHRFECKQSPRAGQLCAVPRVAPSTALSPLACSTRGHIHYRPAALREPSGSSLGTFQAGKEGASRVHRATPDGRQGGKHRHGEQRAQGL